MDGVRRGLASGLPGIREAVASIWSWPRRRWVVALVAAGVAALAMGVPTGIVQTSLYTRMTPVTWWDYPVWAVSAVLVGLTAATYVRTGAAQPPGRDRSRRTLAATLLSTFAVGCPICNKLVVALIGVSGALSYWAPLQPILGVLSIGVLAAGLAVRLRGAIACRVPLAR
ncbi:MAG: hypothetical protein ACR2NB_06045 [Solirubrobacteraceae bacterium]